MNDESQGTRFCALTWQEDYEITGIFESVSPLTPEEWEARLRPVDARWERLNEEGTPDSEASEEEWAAFNEGLTYLILHHCPDLKYHPVAVFVYN